MSDSARKTSEMTASSAQICRDLGWVAGDELQWQDPATEKVTRIRLTAVGRTSVLVDLIEFDGAAVRLDDDHPFCLNHRDWQKV